METCSEYNWWIDQSAVWPQNAGNLALDTQEQWFSANCSKLLWKKTTTSNESRLHLLIKWFFFSLMKANLDSILLLLGLSCLSSPAFVCE